MTAPLYDVLGLGNAIVDVLARTDEAFLLANQLHKGSMRLIEEPEAERLFSAMGPATVISGGSVANSIVGVASFGGRGAYIGKVKNDEVGGLFTHDIRSIGVHFPTAPSTDGPATARSFILVTPDGERTMNTYLGACQNLGPEDVDPDVVAASSIVYLEGYLWDRDQAKQAFRRAAQLAHAAGRQVALTLSDSFCVDRFRDEFLDLMRTGALDIVFANESELKSLYQTADFATAVSAFRDENLLGVVTRSEEGCLIVTREQTQAVDAFPIDNLVDTTGAGDLFAAGFLFGLARDLEATTCARMGALAAAEVIQHVGARPEVSLLDLARDNGVL
ncbi:adenosine kinase [Alsobacter metallidurans]|uniref:Adenosine kinase n=1 Tax=Alsobacter metallidurans TaxID=340221 RepID=A0A917MKP4_9HYPH|nr:adenosine kinase [Alsobacter metallidurans]GGH33712.1 adenosine kinase [Alsobacter metallidurans]